MRRHPFMVVHPSRGKVPRVLSIALVVALSGLLRSVPAADDGFTQEEGPEAGAGLRPRRPLVEEGIAIDRPTQAAIDRALSFLKSRQNRNGSWSDLVGRKVHNQYWGELADHIGVTALAGIAFLASGSLPDQGPYHEAIQGALEYILAHVQTNGFVSANGSRMYEHAFATLFLAEVYGMTRDERVSEKLKLAVKLIVNAQNQQGGWRYQPGVDDSDMSVTVCQVMALRAARNAGVRVPRSTIDRAVQYVRNSFRSFEGAFDYQYLEGSGRPRTSFALTAAGVTTLFGAGEYDAIEIRHGLDYMRSHKPAAQFAADRFDYYYAQYYAVQAMFQAGGTLWSNWYRIVRTDLLRVQGSDGSFRDLVGKNYATAMAAIILQMPYQYLPITER